MIVLQVIIPCMGISHSNSRPQGRGVGQRRYAPLSDDHGKLNSKRSGRGVSRREDDDNDVRRE